MTNTEHLPEKVSLFFEPVNQTEQVVAFTLIKGYALCKKERKAGAASIVTPGQYSASSCIMLTYFMLRLIQYEFTSNGSIAFMKILFAAAETIFFTILS